MNAAENIVAFPAPQDDDIGLVRITPGEYTAVYFRHAGANVFARRKLQVLFRLLEHPALVLPRWYHVANYKGRISAPVHSDLVREVSAVLGQRIRHDRIPVASLAGVVVRVEVSTVETDYRQKPLDPVNQYSVIARMGGRA